MGNVLGCTSMRTWTEISSTIDHGSHVCNPGGRENERSSSQGSQAASSAKTELQVEAPLWKHKVEKYWKGNIRLTFGLAPCTLDTNPWSYKLSRLGIGTTTLQDILIFKPTSQKSYKYFWNQDLHVHYFLFSGRLLWLQRWSKAVWRLKVRCRCKERT